VQEHELHHITKTAIEKIGISLQHIAIMSRCSQCEQFTQC